MATEKKAKTKPKAEAKITKTNVKSYQQDIDTEKQKMTAYSKKMETNVKALQASFKKHAKDVNVAALNMREDGIKKMSSKVNKYKDDIKSQIKENKDAVAKIEGGVKFYLSEINKKKNDFQAYSKAFWG